jgi:hypothetical protein
MGKTKTMVERPIGVSVISVINFLAAIITLVFWGLVYFRIFAQAQAMDPVLRASFAATLGFLVGDIVWAVPLLFLSWLGLWRLRDWGWLLAQIANGLWLYSMTVIWVRDLYAGTISPGALLFTPFTLVALWAAPYLWRKRSWFWSVKSGNVAA